MSRRMENGPQLWNSLIGVLQPYFGKSIVVAGGAVRDYFLKFGAKDIDLFTWGVEWEKADAHPWLTQMDKKDSNEYENLREVEAVFEGEEFGHKVNVVVMSDKVIKPGDGAALVRTFDFGITRGWWDRDGLHMLQEMMRDISYTEVSLLIGERRERSLRRFDRFNGRHDWRYKLIDRTDGGFTEIPREPVTT